MVENQGWAEHLTQASRRTLADFEKTGVELIEQLEDGAVHLTGAQRRSLEQVMDSLSAPRIRNVVGIVRSASGTGQAGETADPVS